MALEHAPAICGSEGKDLPVGNHEDNLRPRDAPRMNDGGIFFLIEDAIEETLLTVAVSSLSNRELRIVMLYP